MGVNPAEIGLGPDIRLDESILFIRAQSAKNRDDGIHLLFVSDCDRHGVFPEKLLRGVEASKTMDPSSRPSGHLLGGRRKVRRSLPLPLEEGGPKGRVRDRQFQKLLLPSCKTRIELSACEPRGSCSFP